jgi:hypothetical protein
MGIDLQMMQQLTGINFIFYYGVVYFTSLHTISNPFLISLIRTLVNVCSTPISFWMVERFGRRNLLICGGTEVISQYIVGNLGVTAGQDKGPDTNKAATFAMIAFNLHQHFHVRLNLVTLRVGRFWRDIPTLYQIPWCWAVNCL